MAGDPIQILSTIAGGPPPSLRDGEFALDRLNGVLYWKDASNVIRGNDISQRMVGNFQTHALGSTFSTSSGTDVEAFLGTEISRASIVPLIATTLKAKMDAQLQATRSAPACGALATLQLKKKVAGVYGSWTSIITDREVYGQMAGVTSSFARGSASGEVDVALASDVTHYQLRIMLRVSVTASTPLAYLVSGSTISTMERA